MFFIMVVSRSANFRRLCVDNLVIRGHLAVGVASADEGKRLLQGNKLPDLILVCSDLEHNAPDIQQFRNSSRLASVPVVLVSPDKPDPKWAVEWKIASHIPYPLDARSLVGKLSPWLKSEETSADFSMS
jgi:hypothetical protein